MPKTLLLIISLALLSSCQYFKKLQPYNGPWLKVTLEIDPAELPANLSERKKLAATIETILYSRLEKLEIPVKGIITAGDYTGFDVLLGADSAADVQKARHLLMAQGKMEFRPCYAAGDIIKQLAAVNSGAQEGTNAGLTRQLFTVLMPAINNQGEIMAGAAIGYTLAKDTAAVIHLLSDTAYTALLPADVRWVWSQKPKEGAEEAFTLYAIEQSAPFITNGAFKEAKVELDRNMGTPILNITLTDEAAKRWEKMTDEAAHKQNQRGCIAIIYNDAALLVPTVYGKISGGKMQISGANSLADLEEIRAMIASAEMPVHLRITAEGIEKNEASGK
ncbi:MAG: hypothetical protein U0V74_08325 [Chitinophagales bacterium]